MATRRVASEPASLLFQIARNAAGQRTVQHCRVEDVHVDGSAVGRSPFAPASRALVLRSAGKQTTALLAGSCYFLSFFSSVPGVADGVGDEGVAELDDGGVGGLALDGDDGVDGAGDEDEDDDGGVIGAVD